MSEGKKVRWTIASARQEFPTLVDMAAREPQDIYRRDELVARVVAVDTTQSPPAPSPRELLTELQRICAEEDYELPTTSRTTRANPLTPGAKQKRKAPRARRRKSS